MAIFFGTGGNDSLTGTNTSDQYYAGSGNDTITTGGGIDAVSAGDGNDILNLVPGDSGQGEGGADVFKISAGNNPGLNNGTLTIYGDYAGLDADVLDVSALIADGWTLDTLGITSTDGQNLGGVGSLGYHGRMVLSKPGFTSISIVYNDIESFITAPQVGPVDGLDTGEVMGPDYTDAKGDQIDGSDGPNDTIFGNGGNDTIDAGAGNDTVDGGADNDRVTGGAGNDSVIGGTGSDSLAGGSGNDVLDGGAGDDDIGVGGADTAAGGAGDDVFSLDATDPATDINAVIDGGTDATSGNPDGTENGNSGDSLDLSAVSVGVTVALSANPETGTVNGLDADAATDIAFTEIEKLLTGSGNDTITGATAAGPVDVNTGAGDDRVTTGSGNDTVTTGIGNDSIVGGGGADVITAGVLGLPDIGYPGLYAADGTPADDLDTVYGGAGADTISTGDDRDLVYGGTEADSIDGGFDNDSLYGDEGADTIEGGEGADLIYGGAEGDVIYGGLSNPALDSANIPDATDLAPNNGLDTIYGGDGSDLILGQDDADELYGDAGADTLDGGIDDDSLYGGGDADSLTGGDGRDRLDGGAGVDALSGGSGADQFIADGTADTITDFDVTTGIGDADTLNNDNIDLSAFYNAATLAAWNAANPGNTFNDPLDWLRADQADGVLQSAGGLRILNGGSAVAGAGLTTENTSVICFARGTRITTIRGQVAVEDLAVDDMLLTVDNGYKPIRWIGSRRVEGLGKFAPIRFEAGVLTNDQALTVSPQHRVQVKSSIAAKMFGSQEVLVAAKHLLGLPGVTQLQMAEVEYFHFLLDQHELVISEGAVTETLFTGPEALRAVEPAARAEILAIFPDLADLDHARLTLPVRPLVTGRMGRQLAVRHLRNNKRLVA